MPTPRRKPAHYRGTYHVASRKVREAAYADPSTRCWRCGKLLHEHGPRARWTAGHLIDGDPTSPLAAEASTCNYSAGAKRGAQMQAARRVGYVAEREW